MKNLEQTIYNSLFPTKLQKSETTKLRILESAIWCYVKYGIENTTYDNLALKAGVTRPLVMRYFPEKESLLELSIKYIAALQQKLSVDAFKDAPTPPKMLELYVRSNFRWVQDYPQHAKVWLLFYYYCSINKNFLSLNSELVAMGHERIGEILKIGIKQKYFKVRKMSSTAKIIQNFLTGSLLSLLTEREPTYILDEDEVVEICISMTYNDLGAPTGNKNTPSSRK